MMRTKGLHARLAYVMRVENHVSIAYAAVFARSVLRRGLRAQRTPRPPVARGVDAVGLRIARLAYVMYYSLGTRAHVICKS